MAGQTNSWMGQINISPIPCIGDTVRKISSTNQYANGDYAGGESALNIDGESPIQSASLWWLIGAGLLIGLLVKGNKRQRTS